jgi:hypothetical protein
MARLTNTDLHNNLNLVKKDVEYLRQGQMKMQEDLTMIKKTLLDPDNGAVARVNRNTEFRKKSGTAIWSVWIAVLGILGKMIFWN